MIGTYVDAWETPRVTAPTWNVAPPEVVCDLHDATGSCHCAEGCAAAQIAIARAAEERATQALWDLQAERNAEALGATRRCYFCDRPFMSNGRLFCDTCKAR